MRAVAVGQLGGQTVAVTGGSDGTVALWRLGEDGLAPAGDPQPGHGGRCGVQAVAVGQVGGQTVAVTGGCDGTVALWRLGEDGLAPAGDPQPGHGGDIMGCRRWRSGSSVARRWRSPAGTDGTVRAVAARRGRAGPGR